MPGFLLDESATVLCAHGGQAEIVVPNEAVTIDGMSTALLPDPWAIAGCPGVPPPVPPCVAGQWIVGTTRVTSYGQPLAIQTGVGLCAPSGGPLLAGDTQIRVVAT